MSDAEQQYLEFASEVSQHLGVFTFTRGGEYLVFSVNESGVIPFWSSEARLQRVQQEHAGDELTPTRLSVSELLAWLPDLEKAGIHLGINWAGAELTGYDIEPAVAREMLERQLAKVDKLMVGPWDLLKGPE